MLYKFIKIDCEYLSIFLPPHSSLTMTSIQDTSTNAQSTVAATTNVVYGIWVTLTDDDEKLTFGTTYFLNVADAYECYKEMMCELGKNFAALELIGEEEGDIARLLDSVTDVTCGARETKSLEVILKDLETPMTDSERNKMIVREKANDLKFSVPNPATEEKRIRVSNALKSIVIAAESKRLREQYDSDDSDDTDCYDCDDCDEDDCDEDDCDCYASVVPESKPEPDYNPIQFANLVYDVRRLPDDVFDVFFKELLKEQASREGFKKVREASKVRA